LKNPKRTIPINAKVTSQETILILGAGPAGHTAAEELRHQGFNGRNKEREREREREGEREREKREREREREMK